MNEKKRLKLFYAAGPGDVVETYRFWKKGEDDPSNPGLTDSSQFYDIIKELNAEALVISYNPRRDKIVDGDITIINLPRRSGTGLFYHIFLLYYGFKILWKIFRFKPDIAILEMDTSHYFLWNLLSIFHVKTIISLKNTIWNRLIPLNKKQKILQSLNLSFFKNHVNAIVSISKYIDNQIDDLTNHDHPPIFNFGTVYRKVFFEKIPPPNISEKPFHILYFGRVEREKGVFDLVEIAKRLKQEGIDNFQISICGCGSKEDELQHYIARNSIGDCCKFEGFCNREKYLSMVKKAHLFIVPTRSSFAEGRNSVAVESIICGRPLVTSESSNALDVVSEATFIANVDDVESYVQAIKEVYLNPDLYKNKQSKCKQINQPFFDLNNSWKSAIKKSINLIINVTNKPEIKS